MLTGRMPFQGQSAMEVAMQQVQTPPPALSSFVPDVAPELEELVLRLLAKKPVQRPASAEAVRRELKAIARRVVDATVLAAPPQAPEASEQDKARRPVAAVTREAPGAIPPSSVEQAAVPVAARGPHAGPPVLLAAEPRSASRAPTTEVISAPHRQPVALWAGLSVLLVLLGAGGAYWMTRSPAPVPVTPPPAVAQPVPAPPPVAPAPTPTPARPAEATAQAPAVPAPEVQPPPSQSPSQTQAVATQAEVPPPVQTAGGAKPTVRAEKAEGTLRLQMKGWAELWVDDELHGRVPPNVLKLPPGRHLIELRGNPAFEDSQQTVLIRSGKETFLQIDRRPVATGG